MVGRERVGAATASGKEVGEAGEESGFVVEAFELEVVEGLEDGLEGGAGSQAGGDEVAAHDERGRQDGLGGEAGAGLVQPLKFRVVRPLQP